MRKSILISIISLSLIILIVVGVKSLGYLRSKELRNINSLFDELKPLAKEGKLDLWFEECNKQSTRKYMCRYLYTRFKRIYENKESSQELCESLTDVDLPWYYVGHREFEGEKKRMSVARGECVEYINTLNPNITSW